MRSFTTRWLVSIADTFADYGRNQERSNAMLIVILANVTRMVETERLSLNDATVNGERLEGKGVTPTIEVPFDIPYAGGHDPQLEKAVEVLSNGSRG